MRYNYQNRDEATTPLTGRSRFLSFALRTTKLRHPVTITANRCATPLAAMIFGRVVEIKDARAVSAATEIARIGLGKEEAIWRARIARTRTSPCNPELERTRLNRFLPTRCNTSRNLSVPKDPLSRVRNSSLTFPPATSDASTCFQSRRSSNTFLRASGRRAAHIQTCVR